MGLDMYLYARAFASKYYDPANLFQQVKPILENLPGEDSYYIQKQVAYWRKANAIHGWFVENAQGGRDECQYTYVTKEDLQELRSLCIELLATRNTEKAEEELPPTQGFFFGGDEIDDWYWQDLQDTADQLGAILNNPALDNFDFIYRSSW